MRFETPRLIIRTYEATDVEPWLELVNDPDVLRFVPPGPPATAESFQRTLEQRRAMERELGYTMWAVELKGAGSLVGQCGLFPAETKGPEIELAYHYKKEIWNKGYATEAAIAVLARAFGPIGIANVIAVVMPENVGSCRVVEKAGMRFKEIATYYEIAGLKKYEADRAWWRVT